MLASALPYLVVVALIAVVFVLPAWLSFRREERSARAELARAEATGRGEPLSIRPWVDPGKCMGSGSCIRACPEAKVLQILDGRAQLANASHCVGHGACVDACPTGAVTLVYGTERRGVDVPEVNPDFGTNVAGLSVAGELGGMGLIANAVEQGIQAVQAIARSKPERPPGGVDLVIVGAGPAGVAGGLEALRLGLVVEVLEQGRFGGAIRHYPRAKIVMSRGFRLPGQRRVPSGTLSKEQLIALFEEAVVGGGLLIREEERVESVSRRTDGGFDVGTTGRELSAAAVLLAVGRRGSPRRLEVPGEELEKVAYRLLEPEQHQHEHVLVVGGGDSAVEAACALAEQVGCRVTLSYRGEALTRPREANQRAIAEAVEAGRVRLLLGSTIDHIAADRVLLRHLGEEVVIPNDHLFIFAGGVLPSAFLAAAGVKLQRHFGKRVEDLGGAA